MELRDVTIIKSRGWRRFRNTNVLISKTGRVFNMKSKKFVNSKLKTGYMRFTYDLNGRSVGVLTHRAVCEVFLPNPQNKEQVNHKNLNRADNRVENLEWCTRVENLQHSWDNGKKRCAEKHGGTKFTNNQVIEIKKLKGVVSIKDIAKIYNSKISTIGAILRGQNWKSINP